MRKESLELPGEFEIPQASAWMKSVDTPLHHYDGPCEGVLVDVGAHTGLLSVRAAQAGFESIYCYEASTHSFQALHSNMQLVKTPGVSHQLHNLAVTSVTGQEFILYDYKVKGDSGGTNTGMRSALYRDGMRNVHSQVQTISLEDIISCHPRIEFLKVDIEGGEYTAFKPTASLRELLRRVHYLSVELHTVADPTFFDPVVFERTHPWYSSAEAAGPELVDFLRKCGFIDSSYELAMDSPTEEFASYNRNRSV